MHKGQESDGPAELESQFILRLPPEPAKVLREAIRSGNSLKDRISLKIENDMRHGEVRVDHWLLTAKVLDLPTIVESLKTIDGKGFYKTADICQMVLCKEEDDQTTTDEDVPQKNKKKDPYKVEKKYLWPHGITPPTKNIRKRRFRKTLKKKYVEAPEIEKEVKRLLRIDNDAVNVKWEVINEDDENKVNKGTVVKKEPVEAVSTSVGEHDIFGGAVSDSEEEDTHLNVLDMDENSQNSADDSRLTDSNLLGTANTSGESKLITEFTSDMFRPVEQASNVIQEQEINYYSHPSTSISYTDSNLTKANIEARLEEINTELSDLKAKLQQQEMKIEKIENHALRQRFQENLDRLLQEQLEKQQEQMDLMDLLKQTNE